MDDRPDLPPLPTLVRTEPVQHRSAQRVALLLDAAAELIDANGIDILTTSDVATRSGSSVGVVYRYFPNIQSLLRALAGRNFETYTARVVAMLASDTTSRASALDAAIDVFVDLNRTHPGFRALRFGDVIDDRFLDPELSNNGVRVRSFAAILGERYAFTPTAALIFELEVIVEIEDALLKRAFLLDSVGDHRFIEKARDIAQEYLGRYAVAGGAR